MNKEAMLDDIYTEAMVKELEKLGFKLSAIPKQLMSAMRKRGPQRRPIFKNVEPFVDQMPVQRDHKLMPMLNRVREATKNKVSVYDMM